VKSQKWSQFSWRFHLTFSLVLVLLQSVGAPVVGAPTHCERYQLIRCASAWVWATKAYNATMNSSPASCSEFIEDSPFLMNGVKIFSSEDSACTGCRHLGLMHDSKVALLDFDSLDSPIVEVNASGLDLDSTERKLIAMTVAVACLYSSIGPFDTPRPESIERYLGLEPVVVCPATIQVSTSKSMISVLSETESITTSVFLPRNPEMRCTDLKVKVEVTPKSTACGVDFDDEIINTFSVNCSDL